MVARVVAVRHQVARRFPSTDVVGRDGPRGAGELAFSGEELLVHRRAEDGEHLPPLLDLGELLPRHVTGQEELLRVAAEALRHVLLGRVVIVARRDGVSVDLERAEVLEHVLQFLHVGLFVDRRVGRGLVAEDLRHLDGGDALLEHAFTLHDEVVGELEAVHVDVPVHPLARTDDDLGLRGALGIADGLGFLLGDELLGDQLLELPLHLRRVDRGQVVAHLLPHEHPVRADVDHPALLMQTGDQLLDLGIDQRFAAADGHHRRLALDRRREALLERHHILEVGRVLADASATGAGQVAGVERFELEDHRELRGPRDLVLDDVRSDLDRQGEGKTHTRKSIGRDNGRDVAARGR